MTLTSPACPVADSLLEQVRYVAMAVDEVDEAKVNLVFEPVWEPHMMSEEAERGLWELVELLFLGNIN